MVTMRSILKSFFLFFIISIIFFTVMRGASGFASSLGASLSYLLIFLATATSYKNFVHKNIEMGNSGHQVDLIESIDDKYGLWDEEELSDEEVLERIKKARRPHLSKSTLKTTGYSFLSHINWMRVASYLFLVIVFFLLLRNNFFDVFAYVGGFVVSSIALLVVRFFN